MNTIKRTPTLRSAVLGVWLSLILFLPFVSCTSIYGMEFDASGSINSSHSADMNKVSLAGPDSSRLTLDDLPAATIPESAAPGNTSSEVRLVRTLYPNEWGIPRPMGLTYSYELAQIYLLNKADTEQPADATTTVVTITPHEDLIDELDVAFDVDQAINIAFDDVHQRLILLNQSRAEMARIQSGSNGVLDPTTLDIIDVAQLGLMNAQGMDIDARGERLFVLDHATDEIISIMLNADGRMDGTEVVRINIGHLAVADLRGIAVHPRDGHLYVVSQAEEALYELTQSGLLVRTYDLAAFGLTDPEGLAFVPSTDRTDPADVIHILVADGNLTEQLDVIYLPKIEQAFANHVLSETDDDTAVFRDTDQPLGEILELAFEN